MDEFYMKQAHIQKDKSTCIRAKVGAVIVKDGAIIGQGYNNVVGGIEDCVKKGCIRDEMHIPHGQRREVCRAICAEQLALTEAARNGVNTDGSTIYVTTFPCFICAKLLVSGGISEIVYDNDYPDDLSKQFLKEAGIDVRKI